MTQREEESLIDEMRAAIRADRERAAARAPRAEPAPAPPPPAPEKRRRRLFGRRD